MARILVIDDDRDVRTLVLYELEAAGHEVRVASDGAQGMALQRALAADVVVTDIFMPEKEGIETICDLNAEFPQVKRYHDLGVVTEQLGVAAVLRKPFDTKDLLSSIESVLGEH